MDDKLERRSKRKGSHDKSSEKYSKKKHRRNEEHSSEKKKKPKQEVRVIDDEPDEDMWVEKNIDMDGEHPLATDIPTAESLKLTSHAAVTPSQPSLPSSRPIETNLKRDDWMLITPSPILPTSGPFAAPPQLPTGKESLTDDYGEPGQGQKITSRGMDYFSNLGTEIKKKKREERPDPEKPKISSKELNIQMVQGKSVDEYIPSAPKPVVPGGPGSQWRMMKLRRVYETAEEEGRNVEEVGLERFGSLDAFDQAKEERRLLDEREGRRNERGRPREDERSGRGREVEVDRSGEQRWMFADVGGSGASSRSSSFRRPGGSGPSTPSPAPPVYPTNRRLDSLRLPSDATKSPLSQSHTPIPSVMAPSVSTSKRRLSPTSLNKMQAKVLRAKLMGIPGAESLEKEYEEESRKASSAYDDHGTTRVEILPSLDGHGRLYDVGTGREDGTVNVSENRKKKEKFETRDSKTGDIVRYNADDDSTTLGEMLRQEKFGAGMADQKSLDAELANAIMGDGKFQDDLEYMDDNADKLGRKKMRSDAMKRQFAINDYKKTQKVLSTCQFCFGEDDSPPKAPVIAMATRCYLACPTNQELVEGHCYIIPIQHYLSMLEADDDVWDEVRNFMKCLMRMCAEEDKGIVFYETVINIKWQKHTIIECVPLPWEQFEEIPAYFKESILASEMEWSQHKKLIDFSARPGGFRRAMVQNLPYFMVQFDHKGEKGYGHVIEGVSEAAGSGEQDGAVGEGEKGGEFPQYFAAEIIGNMLDIEPRRWRRPKRIDHRHNKERVADFRKRYDRFDWTSMIGKE